MTSKKTTTDNRARNFTFIVYPESAPNDWEDILDNEHIQWVRSPLHDKDTNADGTNKKAHWHILVMFEGKKSLEQLKEITDKLNATIAQKVASAKGLVRYMAHLDNPEKYQYDKADIKAHGGVDIAELLKPTSSAKYVLIKEMATYINEQDITEYEDLFYYAMENRFDDWFPLLCDSCTYVIDALIKSHRNRKKDMLYRSE